VTPAKASDPLVGRLVLIAGKLLHAAAACIEGITHERAHLHL